jgi:hypothetical protein
MASASLAFADPISPIAIGPSVSSPCARARFEFEATGKGNEGSKVLMVEWEEDETTRDVQGTWTIHWDGMTPQQSLSMQSEDLDDGSESVISLQTSSSRSKGSELGEVDEIKSQVHRRYFFLGPKKSVPATITITLMPITDHRPVTWRTNPLPAIFPKTLGEEPGKLGVLHTRWATIRLNSLNMEIERETQENLEGIALQMALNEKQRITELFGVGESKETVADGHSLNSKDKSISVKSSELSTVKSNHAPTQLETDEDELFALPLSPKSPEMAKAPFSFVVQVPAKTL